MTTEWPRRAVGKLVQAPGGAIQGTDYQTTGRSAQPPFPDVAAAIAAPALGLTSQERWADLPAAWAGGGLLLRPHTAADGTVYVVASRLRPVPERPGQPNSPLYIEAIHAARPAAALAFPSLLQLPARLVPMPLTQLDPALPPLALDDAAAAPLPAGWLADCRELLAAVATGTPLTAHDFALTPEEFFARAVRAVACLPGTVRWRVPVAAGVYAVPEADKAGVRYALAQAFRPRAAAATVRATGEAYARWFADATEDGRLCETVQDVMEVVADKFPGLTAWNAMPPADDWQKAVKALTEMHLLEGLRGWVAAPTDPAPGVDHFVHMRADVLALAVAALDGPAAVRDALLPAVADPAWAADWKGVGGSERVAVAGQLLGVLTPLDPAAVARVLADRPLDLPAKLHPAVQKRLSAALNDTPLADWAGLIGRAFAHPTPAWFAGWVAAVADGLVWRAVLLRLGDPPVDATGGWQPAAGGPAAARELLARRQPAETDFQKLLGSVAAGGRAVRLLADHVRQALPAAALRLAIAGRLDEWLDAHVNPDVMAAADDGWVRAVATVAAAQRSLDPRLGAAVLAVWDRLTEADRGKLRPLLRPAVGPLEWLLLGGTPGASTETVAGWVWPLAAGLSNAQPGRRLEVVKAVTRQPALATPDFRIQLLNPILQGLKEAAPGLCLSLRFALSVRDGRPTEYPEVPPAELEVAELWRAVMVGRPPSKAPVLRRLGQFPLAARYHDYFQPAALDPDPGFLAAWVRMVATADRPGFQVQVERAGLGGANFWRFAAGWGQVATLREAEKKLVLENAALTVAYLEAVRAGAPMFTRISRKLDGDMLRTVCRTPTDCRLLYDRSRGIGDEAAAEEFWLFCLDEMADGDRLQLADQVSRGWLGRGFAWVRSKFGDDEVAGGWGLVARHIYQHSAEPTRDRLGAVLEWRVWGR